MKKLFKRTLSIMTLSVLASSLISGSITVNADIADSGNDIEMLRQAEFSFAMANAHEPVIQAAKYRAGSNNEEGVLDIIDRVLKNEAPFTQ